MLTLAHLTHSTGVIMFHHERRNLVHPRGAGRHLAAQTKAAPDKSCPARIFVADT
jgi:hypothetical protein